MSPILSIFPSGLDFSLGQLGWHVVDMLPVPFIVTDPQDFILYLNTAASRLLGTSVYDGIGHPWNDVVLLRDRNDIPSPVTPSTLLANKNAAGACVYRVVRRDNNTSIPVQIVAGKLVGAARNNSAGIGVVLFDQSPFADLLNRLTHQSTHDALTGLVNRHEFKRRLDAAVASAHRDHQVHALCYMDLNRFKNVNDQYGHLAGDEVLQKVATEFRKLVRERDTLARLGGDEFALLMEHCSVEHAIRMVRLFRMTLRHTPPYIAGVAIPIGLSTGVAQIDRHSCDPRAVLAAADAACYTAKRSGQEFQIVERDTAIKPH